MALDRLAADLGLEFEACGKQSVFSRTGDGGVCCKPLTYMNRSGVAVGEMRDRYAIPMAGVLLVSDDYQLPLGRMRIRRKGGAGGHNGLKSVIRTLGTEAFPRLRLGIGPKPRGAGTADYVLSEFAEDELKALQGVVVRAAEAGRLWLENRDIDLCMNRFNQ
jgi:PTH1 family peptidyl-tRNA hydrolase